MTSKSTKYVTFAIILVTILLGVMSAFYDQFSAPSNAVKIKATDSKIMQSSFETDSQTDDFVSAVQIDRPFLEFQASKLNGEIQDITALDKGRSVLHFWATWCAPCILELPELIREAQESEMRFIIISVDDDVPAIERFRNRLIKANGDLNFDAANIIWLHDKDMKVMKDLYNVKKLPESFIVDDAQGKLIKHFEGPADWKNADL